MSCEWLSVGNYRGLIVHISVLSFLCTIGPVDQAYEWQELTTSERTSILNEYRKAGISLMVSLFGSTETPTSSGYNAVTTANTMAEWVLEHGVLGVDVDYEVFSKKVISKCD